MKNNEQTSEQHLYLFEEDIKEYDEVIPSVHDKFRDGLPLFRDDNKINKISNCKTQPKEILVEELEFSDKIKNKIVVGMASEMQIRDIIVIKVYDV